MAITPSRRAIGFAIADRLGLIDADYLNLHDCKSEKNRLRIVKQWIVFAMKILQPDYIVIEELHPKRLNKNTLKLVSVLKVQIVKDPNSKLLPLTRKTALQKFTKLSCSTELKTIRKLSAHFARTCTLLAFHSPPNTNTRTDWDRSWGQAVVAAALAQYVKNNNF